MSTNNLIRKLLKLVDLRVANVEFKGRGHKLLLWVKPYKNGSLCPTCQRRGTIKNILPEPRTWRDVYVCGWSVYFLYCPREIICPTHGRVQEQIPWSDGFARITYRLEYLVLLYAQLMTQKAAAQLCRHRRRREPVPPESPGASEPSDDLKTVLRPSRQ